MMVVVVLLVMMVAVVLVLMMVHVMVVCAVNFTDDVAVFISH